MTRTLTIGGAGFIGSALLKELPQDDVCVFDNFSRVVHTKDTIRSFIKLGAKLFVGDATRREDVHDVLSSFRPDCVVYLVAETGTGRSINNCTLNSSVNVVGISILLDEFSRMGLLPEQFVLTSSRAVYGEGPFVCASDGTLVYPPPRAKEDLEGGHFEYVGLIPQAVDARKHAPRPVNVYGATKLAQENILAIWAHAFGVPAKIFRLQNVFGAGQSITNPYTGVLLHFLRNITQKSPVHIYEDGGITRDFVHVSDVARLLARAIRGHGPAGTFDVGSGVRVKLEDVASEICSVTAAPPPQLVSNFRIGDVRHAAADISYARNAFGWEPHVSLKQGLRDVIKFYKKLAPTTDMD